MHLLNASVLVSIQSLFPPHPPQIIHSDCFPRAGRFMCLESCWMAPLDPVLRLIVVHGLLSPSQEGVHALIRTQEPVHAHDGLKGQDAAETWRSASLMAEL